MKIFNSKGITLVSLVVTIIILIILAGVAISNVIGNHSSVNRAEQAKLTEEQESKKEVLEQALIKYNSGNYVGASTFEEFLINEFSDLNEDDIIQFTDLNGQIAYIIRDFKGEPVQISTEDEIMKIEVFSNLADEFLRLEEGDVLISPKNGDEIDIENKGSEQKNKYAILKEDEDLEDISFDIPAGPPVTIKLLSDMRITNEGKERAAINLHEGATLNLQVYGTVEVSSKYGKDPERANGTPGKPGQGGYAGIHVPKNSTLNLYGTGKLTARGGDAGDGSDAAKGDIGGSGGGGAGAGIGGNGGAGGAGASNIAQDGGDGEDCGKINIYDSITVIAYGGGGGSSGILTKDNASDSGSGTGAGGYPGAGIGGGGAGRWRRKSCFWRRWIFWRFSRK